MSLFTYFGHSRGCKCFVCAAAVSVLIVGARDFDYNDSPHHDFGGIPAPNGAVSVTSSSTASAFVDNSNLQDRNSVIINVFDPIYGEESDVFFAGAAEEYLRPGQAAEILVTEVSSAST